MAKICGGMDAWEKNVGIKVVSGNRFDASLVDQARETCAGNRVAYDGLIKKGNGFLLQSHHKGGLVSNGLFA